MTHGFSPGGLIVQRAGDGIDAGCQAGNLRLGGRFGAGLPSDTGYTRGLLY